MEIRLAGYNVDAEELARGGDAVLTPETISAAYARISRSPHPVGKLRHKAARDVHKARASNESIVFEMGHASIAEHACFNLDVVGLSRLAIEELEAHRLASYTEKSQRYVKLDQDYIVPEELPPGLQDTFRSEMGGLLEIYNRLVEKIIIGEQERDPATWETPAGRRAIQGTAKEDARYVASLAVTGQLGMTVNARSIESMARRMNASPLAEVRELARRLVEVTRSIAPSLIRYTEATGVERWKRRPCLPEYDMDGGAGEVRLVSAVDDLELRIAAACVAESAGGGLEGAMIWLRRHPERVQRILTDVLALLGPHDPMPRAFETVDFAFDLICSASCFAQLKRHRIATVIPGPYDPDLGVTMPSTVEQAGGAADFEEAMAGSRSLYERVAEACGAQVATYALTNAHRRRVLFKCHMRELVHVARLRLDSHAQWDIRRITGLMCDEVCAAAPALAAFLRSKEDMQA